MTVTPPCCKSVSGTPKKSLPVATGARWWKRVSASAAAATVFGPLLKGASHILHLNKLCSPNVYSLLPEVKVTAYTNYYKLIQTIEPSKFNILLRLERMGLFRVLTCELHLKCLTERLQRNKNAAMFFKILLLLLVAGFLL